VTEDPGGLVPRPDPTLLTTAQLDREVSHLKELQNLRFELIDRQRLESKEDNQKALDAALLTAKETVAALGLAYQTGNALLLKSLDELKQRLTSVESTAIGATLNSTQQRNSRSDSRDSLALWVAGASVLLTLILTIFNAAVVHIGH
jgi:hypothetical protein